MSDLSRLAARLTAAQPSVRFVIGSVVAVDAEGCEVDLGDGTTVEAIVSSTVGSVAVDQGVRLSVQQGTYVVESITDGAGWVTGGYTAFSGWGLDVAAYRQDGALLTHVLRINRTGGDINAGSTGNLSDSDVLQMPPETIPVGWPTNRIGMVWQAPNTMGSGHITISTGVLSLDDIHPNGSISTGDWMQATFVYPM